MWDDVTTILNTELIVVGGAVVTPAKVLFAIGLVVGGFYLSRWLSRFLEKRLHRTGVTQDGRFLIGRIVFYTLLGVFVMTAISVLGIPLTAFAFVSGAIAIGVGFGAQNIINNFISGWILMGERPIRVGDFIELQGTAGVVEHVHNRYTRIRRVDGVHMLVPNSWILENTVINWTLVDRNIRSTVRVGVEYGSDVHLVHRLITGAVQEHPDTLAEPEVQVFFQDFGDNALLFEAYFWTEASGEADLRRVRSDIRFRITDAFAEHGIIVAFPQRDVHLDGTLVLERPADANAQARARVPASAPTAGRPGGSV